MKKFALKGLIVLAVVVLGCIFFSGTLHTITTAKVQLTAGKTGKLESRLSLTGALYWPSTESVFAPEMSSEDSLILRRLNVTAGSYVHAGDLIAVCDVSDYDNRLDTMQTALDTKEKEYLEQKRKTDAIRLMPQEEAWFTAYRQLKAALGAESEARMALRVAARSTGITLEEDDTLPAVCGDETLAELREKLTAAEKESAAAQKAFDQANRISMSEDTVTAFDKLDELKAETDKQAESLAKLKLLKIRAGEITAPHDGYVTSSELKAGDSVTGTTTIVTLSGESAEPVIRLDASGSKKTVSEGAAVSLSAGSKTVETTVSEQGVSSDGTVYIDVKLKKSDLGSLGGISAISEANSVTADISWKAERSTTLIPLSALREENGENYVYIAQETTDTFGAEKLKIARKPVTVLGRSDTIASVEESLRDSNIVYMEDRPLTDGCEVMRYSGSGT